MRVVEVPGEIGKAWKARGYLQTKSRLEGPRARGGRNIPLGSFPSRHPLSPFLEVFFAT